MTSPRAAAPPAAPAAVPAAERGATVIPEKVVARIARRAAQEALAHYAATAPARSAPLARPRAEAAVTDGTARLGLTLELPYPADLARTCRAVQEHVSERVGELTGMRITEVTLVIEHLVLAGGPEHRRVR
ncbi:Asp23/Gls24 family envelope stress response protein [Streptomyces sp. NPDC012888]|uniref:Asp23/Gls24 family envelope stress response protein n=1 Tax=Streptomyces sp. NPDC012888 TaxID=3364855 RepID=UPI0036CE4139